MVVNVSEKLTEQKNNSANNFTQIYIHFWENIKQKLIINLEVSTLNKLIENIVENVYLISEKENQNYQNSLNLRNTYENNQTTQIFGNSQNKNKIESQNHSNLINFYLELIQIISLRDKRP
jgi:hypothetical protein